MSADNRKDIKDFVTDAWRNISVEHNNIHEGVFFEYPIVTDIAASGTYVVGFKTPADKYVHYRNEKFSASGEKVLISLQEGATISGGTTVSAINHNRASDKTASTIVKTAVTLATAGTTISIGYVPGGTAKGGNRSGGETSQENEYVLNPNTQYVVRIANGGSATCTVVVSPQWYEEDEGGLSLANSWDLRSGNLES